MKQSNILVVSKGPSLFLLPNQIINSSAPPPTNMCASLDNKLSGTLSKWLLSLLRNIKLWK